MLNVLLSNGQVPEGFEMCTRLMLPEEIALVTCPPDYAYDKFPRQTRNCVNHSEHDSVLDSQWSKRILIVLFLGRPPGVPEGAHVQWEIELLGFETPRVSWSSVDYPRNCKKLPFLMIPENLVTGLDWVGLPEHHERSRKYQKHGMDQMFC